MRQPSINAIASLAGLESAIRGLQISVYPLAIFFSLHDKKLVTEVYFFAGLVSMLAGLLVPWFAKFIPRRFLYLGGVGFYILSGACALSSLQYRYIYALIFQLTATAIIFVCYNAYVLDYVNKSALGRAESKRLLFSAFSWSIGPALGVLLYQVSPILPFVFSIILAIVLLVLFQFLNLGDGKTITKINSKSANLTQIFLRFIAQPRLLAGWIFVVLRSCGWVVYTIYLPIYAIENNLGNQVGGICLSLTNCLLFFMPFLVKLMEQLTLRRSLRIGFFMAGLLFILSIFGYANPWITVGALFVGSLFMSFLDMCAGLPFLMAVKPSERTEMSAVYSSYRDVSGLLMPGIAWMVLLVAPISAVFVSMGAIHFSAYFLAGTLPKKLGRNRKS